MEKLAKGSLEAEDATALRRLRCDWINLMMTAIDLNLPTKRKAAAAKRRSCNRN